MDHSSGTYSFPHYITPSGLQPALMWWSDQQKELWLLKFIISYRSLVADARRRRVKYHDLVEAGREAGYRIELITTEVGSWGMLGANEFDALRGSHPRSAKGSNNSLSGGHLHHSPGIIRNLGFQELYQLALRYPACNCNVLYLYCTYCSSLLSNFQLSLACTNFVFCCMYINEPGCVCNPVIICFELYSSCVLSFELVLVSPLIAVSCVLVSCNEELSKTKNYERERERDTERMKSGTRQK